MAKYASRKQRLADLYEFKTSLDYIESELVVFCRMRTLLFILHLQLSLDRRVWLFCLHAYVCTMCMQDPMSSLVPDDRCSQSYLELRMMDCIYILPNDCNDTEFTRGLKFPLYRSLRSLVGLLPDIFISLTLLEWGRTGEEKKPEGGATVLSQ
ncbi:hypothetical protein STEG23_037058, partial [Scotinomys teguina]